ncbi:hypothetical protein HN954_04570 [bacterium]|jgi:hypothetical protein|nr:hypothetical protein [bacterium]MBT6831693.1 hypothetical protein [bacterium]MBT6996673.1 hypothetical protein [bacterium]MBT7772842.1 hypothetical protein [bacterium]
MKKLSIVFGAFLLIPGIILADEIPAAGLDLELSQIEITFSPDIPNTVLNCFGQSGNIFTTTLEDFGMTEADGEFQAEFLAGNHCFRQAGDYSVKITPVDGAENTGTPVEFNFEINPGTPSDATSTLTKNENCNDAVATGSSKVGDVKNECELTLVVKDKFENPVTQLNDTEKTLSVSDLETTESNPDPAAEIGGTSFLGGLLAGGSSTMDSLPFDFEQNAPEKIFKITAKVPSLKKATTNSIPETAAREIQFQFSLPTIKLSGLLGDSGDGDIFKTIPLQFAHPFSQTAEAISTEIISAEGDPTTKITANLSLTDPTEPATWAGSFPTGFSGITGSIFGAAQSGLDSFSFGAFSEFGTPISNFANNFDAGISTTDISFSTKIGYSIGDTPVGYETCPVPSPNVENPVQAFDCGATTCSSVTEENCVPVAENVGVDIEGNAQGDISKNFFVDENSETPVLNIGAVTATDIREEITQNAFRMIRGIVADSSFALETSFNDTDVVLVNLENGSLTISGELPAGQNTLIVHNGNLIISGDLTYATATENQDSFGVILINDDATTPPTTGNIFVRPAVKEISGSFYADGAILTNTTDIISGWTESGLENQLRLTGALLTHNTIGGANDETALKTPWGDTINDTLAKKYDLNFVRQFPLGGGDCTEISANQCDENGSSFIIRLDGKASSQLAPPGFRLAEEVRR